MKKSKIFITAAALVLGITAFVASKANNKRGTSFQTAVTASGGLKLIGSSSTYFTITPNGHKQLLRTAGGMNITFYSKVLIQHPAYVR